MVTTIYQERGGFIPQVGNGLVKRSTIDDDDPSGDGGRSGHYLGMKRNEVGSFSTVPQAVLSQPLPPSLVKSIPKLYQEKLVPIDLKFGVVRPEDYTLPVALAHKKVLAERQFLGRAKASICFVVKRPGCVICKEQGLMLKELVSSFPGNRVAAWAVIKEVNVDNDGLLELYQQYFRFPFFMDKQMKLYKALGKKFVNPFTFFYNVNKNAKKRIEEKGIPGTFVGKGEGLILGGVLIFDRHGDIRYAFQENSTAQELPVDEFRRALNDIIDCEKNNTNKRRKTKNVVV